MRAIYNDGEGSTGPRIDVTGLGMNPGAGTFSIYPSILEYCCQLLSTNELKEIVRQVERQLVCIHYPRILSSVRNDKHLNMLYRMKDVIGKRVDEAVVPNYPRNCSTPSMRVNIMRSLTLRTVVIEVVRPGGLVYMFEDDLKQSYGNFFGDELVEVVRQLERQLSCLTPSDIPPAYVKVLGGIRDDVRRREEERPVLKTGKAYRPDRPYFGPDQVRHACQLVVGRTYDWVYVGHTPFKKRFTLRRGPYFENGAWWIDNEYDEYPKSDSLADHSVLPYKDGQWNHWNYYALVKTTHCRHHCCCCQT